MGGSFYSRDHHAARVSHRLATSTPVFKHDADIKAGKTRAAVEPRLQPLGATRESRDSDAHPVTVPIAIFLDTTGSMQKVPAMIEARLSKLMGHFLDDKASGKPYLGDGYPAILIGAVDDYDAMSGEGCLQVGQFESGIEIDNDLERLWLTGRGGGTYEESYELAIYFMARHAQHDAWDKRRRKGYLFLIGDEHPYGEVNPRQVKAIIGSTIQAPIPVAEIIREAQKRYHVFFVIPNMTQHYADASLEQDWVKLLGQQNVLKLDDPEKICEMIVSAVALCEAHVGIDDLLADDVATGISGALVPLSRGAMERFSADSLPTAIGPVGQIDRL